MRSSLQEKRPSKGRSDENLHIKAYKGEASEHSKAHVVSYTAGDTFVTVVLW